MVNSITAVVDILNGFPEFEFDSSTSNFEFPKMISRNDSGVDSVMGLWSMMDRGVREKHSEKTIGRSVRNTKVNTVKLDPFESNSFTFDDSFVWDNHSESKQIENDRIERYKSPHSPQTPHKHRRRLCLQQAIDEALKQTNPLIVEECNATKGSRNKCATTRRKKVVEGRRMSTSRISRKDVDDYEENSIASFNQSSNGDLSSVDQMGKGTPLSVCSERKATDITNSKSRRRSHQHQRGSKDALLCHSSERVKSSSSKSRVDKKSIEAIPFASCDLLGDNHGEVKPSRRHSHTVIDEHEISKGKRREKKQVDSNERRSTYNLSRCEKTIDSDDLMLTSSSYQSPPQNRRRSLNFSVEEYIDPQQLQIDRLCEKICQMENVRDRKQTRMTSTSEMNMSNSSNSDTPPKKPTRIVSPKAIKKQLPRNSLTMLFDANKLDMMH